MTTTGTWYPPAGLAERQYDPSAGTGSFLINPPFATMSNERHPITPPPELVRQWLADFYGPEQTMPGMAPGEMALHLAAVAARWGADQELEECCEYIGGGVCLRAARRPKPPSLKEQALALVDNLLICDHLAPGDESILRRALEALPE